MLNSEQCAAIVARLSCSGRKPTVLRRICLSSARTLTEVNSTQAMSAPSARARVCILHRDPCKLFKRSSPLLLTHDCACQLRRSNERTLARGEGVNERAHAEFGAQVCERDGARRPEDDLRRLARQQVEVVINESAVESGHRQVNSARILVGREVDD